jgi:hypothetical protein
MAWHLARVLCCGEWLLLLLLLLLLVEASQTYLTRVWCYVTPTSHTYVRLPNHRDGLQYSPRKRCV